MSSLDTDLLLPPRGPVKWGWLTRMIEKIARRAGVVSPDDSVQISRTHGGITISPRRTITPVPDGSLDWSVTKQGGYYACKGGTLNINAVDPVTVADAFLGVPGGDFVCVRFEAALNDPTITPRFWESMTDYTISATAPPALVAVSINTIREAQFWLPGTRTTGLIYIPIARITPDGAVEQLKNLNFEIVLYLRHQDFDIFD